MSTKKNASEQETTKQSLRYTITTTGEELTQLKTTDIKGLKEKLHEDQGELCPILKHWFPPELIVLDHAHKSKRADEPGVDGKGLIRGCIHTSANIILGKIENSWVRTGLHKQDYITLPMVLRNMADYLEREHLPFIHPTEKIPEKKLKKSSFNKLIKTMKEDSAKKLPTYPSSKKLTKELAKLYEKYNTEPEFY